MLRFVLGRLAGLAPVVVAALIATFVATRLLPGDPVAVMLSDHSADAAMAARLRAEYGLDRPLIEQFLRYVAGIADRRLRPVVSLRPHAGLERAEGQPRDQSDTRPGGARARPSARRVRGYSGRDPPQPAARHRDHRRSRRGPVDPQFRHRDVSRLSRQRAAQSPSGRRLGHAAPGDPARGHPGDPERRLHRAADANLHARSAATGLRAHRARQGTARTPRHLPPRVPQHAGAAGDVRRHDLRRAVEQHRRGRDHLQHSRTRPARDRLRSSRATIRSRWRSCCCSCCSSR